MGFVIERRDEYQLCAYILTFKGYQFFSSGLFSLLSFAAVDAYCVSWAPIEEMYACRSTGLVSGLGLGLRPNPNPSPNPNQVRVPQHGARSAHPHPHPHPKSKPKPKPNPNPNPNPNQVSVRSTPGRPAASPRRCSPCTPPSCSCPTPPRTPPSHAPSPRLRGADPAS